jgi:hypothetical protein
VTEILSWDLERLWPKFELDPEFEEKLRVSA